MNEFIPGDLVCVRETQRYPGRFGVVIGSGAWYLSELRGEEYVTVLVSLPGGSRRWNVRPERLELINETR